MTALCSGKICTIFPEKGALNLWKACTIALEYSSHGFIKINRIDVDSKENRGRYLSKYFGKDLDLKEHKKKAFFKSQNLKVPHETKVMLTEDILHDLQKENIVFQKEYTRQIYDTNAFLSTGSCLKDSSVIYIKIKKENPCVKGESYG